MLEAFEHSCKVNVHVIVIPLFIFVYLYRKMPGTIHDEAAMEITSMWKCDGVVQITDEMELTVVTSFMSSQLFQL